MTKHKPKPHIKLVDGLWEYRLSNTAKRPVLISSSLNIIIWRVNSCPNKFGVKPKS